MKRIDTSTRALNLFGAGKDGFRNSNLGLGIAATDFNADWPNGVQEEIMAVIEAAGLVASGGDLTQLKQAILLLCVGRLRNIQIFASSGTYTPTAGTKAVRVRLVGGGGAGGGSQATNASQIAFGTGGGYGGYGEGYFTAGFAGVAVTVGAAGARNLGTNGGGGGASSFGALISVNGGGGGGSYGPTSAPLTAGLGNGAGVGSGGYLQLPGQTGGYGFMTAGNFGYSGRGASGIWGAGGGEQNGSGDGVAGSGYGAGGSGGMSPISSTVRYGGNGTSGLVIVEEFA